MWEVIFKSGKVQKQAENLPAGAAAAFALLADEMKMAGPVRGNWPNYSKLSDGSHHCHLKKGRPTYVAVWKEAGGNIKLIRIAYVGTHEKAPY